MSRFVCQFPAPTSLRTAPHFILARSPTTAHCLEGLDVRNGSLYVWIPYKHTEQALKFTCKKEGRNAMKKNFFLVLNDGVFFWIFLNKTFNDDKYLHVLVWWLLQMLVGKGVVKWVWNSIFSPPVAAVLSSVLELKMT